MRERLEGVNKMDNRQIEFEFERATESTYRLQEKTFTDLLGGTLYVRRVAEFLKKIEEVLEG